jgi:hypothetical protein
MKKKIDRISVITIHIQPYSCVFNGNGGGLTNIKPYTIIPVRTKHRKEIANSTLNILAITPDIINTSAQALILMMFLSRCDISSSC